MRVLQEFALYLVCLNGNVEATPIVVLAEWDSQFTEIARLQRRVLSKNC